MHPQQVYVGVLLPPELLPAQVALPQPVDLDVRVQLELLLERLPALIPRALVIGAVDAREVAPEARQAEELRRAADVAVVLRRRLFLK